MMRGHKEDFTYETSKVFYLEDNEIVELEMPLIMDITQLMYGKLKVITKSNYPVNQFINVDLTLMRTRFSLVGKVIDAIQNTSGLYEISILLEALPNGLMKELNESMGLSDI